MDRRATAGHRRAGAEAHEVQRQPQDVDAAQRPNPMKSL
jgi:hypothetical protein